MENLIIIGNGFDLNLGLKTSYFDFTNSPEYLPLLRDNNNTLARELHNSCQQCQWIDIENELKDYSKEYPWVERFEKHYDALKEALVNYLNTIDVSLMNRNALAYQVLKDLVNTDFLILDFNFTDTTRQILQELGLSDVKISTNLKKIHGTLKDNNIIFGVEDDADIDSANHIFIKKSSALNFQGIELTNFLAGHTNLHIFGHSLGETDRTYFQNYFEESLTYRPTAKHEPQGTVYLYYYGKKGWNALIKQIDAMTGQRNNIYRSKVKLTTIDSSLPLSPVVMIA